MRQGGIGPRGLVGIISDTLIRGNVVLANGGGAVAGGIGVYGRVTLRNSSVRSNETRDRDSIAWSAGIHLFRGIGILTAIDTTIANNTARGLDARGGGFFVRPGTSATLESSPVTGNSVNGATARGGGIANQAGSASLTDSPVIDQQRNGSVRGRRGLFNDGGPFSLHSSPVLHNQPDNCFALGRPSPGLCASAAQVIGTGASYCGWPRESQ